MSQHVTKPATSSYSVIDAAAIEQEGFLERPALFTYGPAALLVISVALTIGAIFAGMWRVSEGQVGAYASAFQQTEAMVVSAEEALSQILGRLDSAVVVFQTAQHIGGPAAARTALANRMELIDKDVDMLLLDGSGVVLAKTGPLSAKGRYPQGPMPPLGAFKELTIQAVSVSPFGGGRTLPISIDLTGPRSAGVRLTFFLPLTRVQALTNRIFGATPGSLALLDKKSQVVLEVATDTLKNTSAPPPSAVLTMYDDKLFRYSGTSSPRLLAVASKTPHAGVTVRVGVLEKPALAEFSTRVFATWVIVGVFSFLLLGFGGV